MWSLKKQKRTTPPPISIVDSILSSMWERGRSRWSSLQPLPDYSSSLDLSARELIVSCPACGKHMAFVVRICKAFVTLECACCTQGKLVFYSSAAMLEAELGRDGLERNIKDVDVSLTYIPYVPEQV